MELFDPATQLRTVPVSVGMAHVYSPVFGEFLEYPFDGLVTDVVTVDE